MLKNLFRERSRTRMVRALDLPPLDDGGTAEPGLERYVEQAANAFAAPMTVVTLIHDDTLWVAASRGLSISCVPREQGFCNRMIDSGDMLEVCDAAADPRFRDLPGVVGEPHVRYYLGAPLALGGGTDVGGLCVLDVQPRLPASPDQRAYLKALARQVSAALDQRLAASGMLAA